MATKKHTHEELCIDLLMTLVRKLSFHGAVSFSRVCRSWRRAATMSRVFSRPILLTIPGYQPRVSNVDGSPRLSLRVHSLSKGKMSRFGRSVSVSLTKQYHYYRCIGSSKHMLVLQNTNDIIIVNLFSRKSFCVPLDNGQRKSNARRRNLISHVLKAVVLGEQRNLDVLVINSGTLYASTSSIFYYREGSWAMLDSNCYVDMVARERRLFAMTFSGSVEAWDFNRTSYGPPTKVMSFIPFETLPIPVFSYIRPYERRFLVESAGEFFLVMRFLRKRRYFSHVHGVTEDEEFHVYKCCLSDGEKWKKVESIGDDKALFLGMNESVLVSIKDLPKGWKGNSIYFTGDYHCVLTDCPDVGFYSLKHKQTKILYVIDDNIDVYQPAIWMVGV